MLRVPNMQVKGLPAHEIKAAEKVIAQWSVELDAIKRALDQALSLLLDPYTLFDKAPDAIRLLLTQAIFDKLWIMDAEVVGSDLTDTYLELLTADARLAEEANERADRAVDGLAVIPAPRTCYRRPGAITGDDGEDLTELAERLWVERPHGVLPVDALNSENPASPAVMTGFRHDSFGRGDRT